MAKMKFENQVALVTGGGAGLGLAFARGLVAEGASVVLCGRRMDVLESAAAQLGPEHLALRCDVTQETDIASVVASTIAHYGKLDILVNNAGIGDWIPFEETSTEYFDAVIATNLRGPFLCSRHAWPHLKESKGQILNISSIAGDNAYTDMSAYCSSKWGLNGLTQVLALEGAPFGIRAMSVGPGAADTDIWGDHATPEQRGRMMTIDQVADLGLWMLASPRNVHVKTVIIENFVSAFAE
ncbi:MAG: SDR family NAD(P)-dependent oxidoreductase [Armatimonadetes bacterium]|nr:SDR family NAD(P)-dependent oxidoreductase [Armatimonadota bacterium]